MPITTGYSSPISPTSKGQSRPWIVKRTVPDQCDKLVRSGSSVQSNAAIIRFGSKSVAAGVDHRVGHFDPAHLVSGQ